MRISAIETKNKRTSPFVYFLIFAYFCFTFIIEFLLCDYLTKLGNEIVENVQLNWNTVVLNMFGYISYLGTLFPLLILIVVIYNYSNIYKSFIILLIFFIAHLLTNILKLVYKQKRPFFEELNIKPLVFCYLGYGNPSGHMLMTTSIYLTIWHILYANSSFKEKKYRKYLSLSITITMLVIIFLSTLFSGFNCLNQLIFGLLIGIGIYLSFFYVLNVDLNNGHQFENNLLTNNITCIIVNAVLITTEFLLFYVLPISNHDQWNTNIDKIDICKNIPVQNRFADESFLGFPIFLGNIFAFLGVKFEYYFTFQRNSQDWNKYNFEKIEKLDDSMLSKISDDIQIQWNHTPNLVNVVRLILILIMTTIILLPAVLISWENSIYIIFFFKFLTPVALVSFSMFYLYKLILKKLRLINQELFNALDDFESSKNLIENS